MQELNKGKDENKSWTDKLIGYVLGSFFAIVLFLPMALYGILSHAFVAMKLWNWFVASTFDLPLMSLAKMAGIYWLVRLLVYQVTGLTKDETTWKQKMWHYLRLALVPWYALFVGYIIHHFI